MTPRPNRHPPRLLLLVLLAALAAGCTRNGNGASAQVAPADTAQGAISFDVFHPEEGASTWMLRLFQEFRDRKAIP